MSLRLDNIRFGYGLGSRKSLFKEFSGNIKKGRVTALLGSNGTGKTTLLKLCCGLLVPDAGTVDIGKTKISNRDKRALAQVFFVPDTLVLPAVNAKDFVKISKPFYNSLNEKLFFELLERFNVKDGIKLTKMSFGQQKKAYLAFAFSTCTPYLFLDEPTNGLDPNSMEELKRIIAETADEDRTIVISTHHLKDIENLCDDFMILDNDHRLHHRSLEEITQNYHFETADGIPTDSIYYEQIFGQSTFFRKRSEADQDSVFNIGLYMNAVISGKIK